jgi:preprotein translocase subunit YajC
MQVKTGKPNIERFTRGDRVTINSLQGTVVAVSGPLVTVKFDSQIQRTLPCDQFAKVETDGAAQPE